MRPVRAVTCWWLPQVSPVRVAWVRAIVAGTAVVDVLVMPSSLLHRLDQTDLYRPVAVARALALPAPTSPLVALLLALTVTGAALLLWGGRQRAPVAAQHAGGVLLALGYPLWCVLTMSYGYVSHDHMAIVVAALVLPTAGTARYAGPAGPAAHTGAGWALRMVQVATVASYTGSLLAKWVLTHGDLVRWAHSATLAWAFLRRPNPVNELLVDQVLLLRGAQWGALALELAAPVVFVLRDRWRLLLIAVFLGFHLSTLVLLGIHFLPTVVCWSAFVPWERLGPRRARRVALRERATATA